jgi:hypothetical protein
MCRQKENFIPNYLMQVVNQVETNGTKWTELIDSGNIVNTLPQVPNRWGFPPPIQSSGIDFLQVEAR